MVTHNDSDLDNQMSICCFRTCVFSADLTRSADYPATNDVSARLRIDSQLAL